MVILGDGYTAGEMDKYSVDVQQFVQAVFAQEPFKEYQRYFNVYRIDVISSESGASHPERTPAVIKNTRFSASYNCLGSQRLICVNASSVLTVVSNSVAPNQRDILVVIVNDPQYGGSGGVPAVVSTHSAASEIMLHELGHSFGLLGDEYGGPPPPDCDLSIEPREPNVTRESQPALIKWNYWIDPATAIPTPTTIPGLPGLYIGARYCDNGLFRPTHNSKMRSLNFPYEQINTEQLIKRIYNLVSPLDSSEPVALAIRLPRGQAQGFSVSTLMPMTRTLETGWLVDGQPQGTGLTFTLESLTLSDGSHSLQSIVKDTTRNVRNDPNHVLVASTKWDVIVETPPRIASASISGKNLIILGDHFQEGAVIEINGNAQRTRNDQPDPTTLLVGKKAGKRIAAGETVTLTVLNPSGFRSDSFTFTKPAE